MGLSFRSQRILLPIFLVFITILLVACGGGSGGSGTDNSGGGETDPGDDKPTAGIAFPPGNAIAFHNTLIVRGTANDNGSVTSVTVNGVTATSSNDFETWTVQLPLSSGDNEVSVTVADDEGNTVSEADKVTVMHRAFPFDAPTGIAVDGVNDRAIVLDGDTYTFHGIDLVSGNRTLLSGGRVGSGHVIRSAYDFALDEDNGKVFVVDYAAEALIEVDLATGDRTILSSTDIGTGDMFGQVRDVAYDPLGDRIFTVEGTGVINEFRIYAIDRVTGDRNLVSSESHGAGDLISLPYGVAWDAVNSRLVVTTGLTELVFVDPDSGDRTKLDLTGVGSLYSYDVELDGNTAYVTNRVSSDRIFEVNLDDGAAIHVTNGVGSGEKIRKADAIAHDAVNGRLLVADITDGTLVSIDKTTLARTVLSSTDDARIGSGDRLDEIGSMTIDASAGEAYAVSASQIMVVDLATGDRIMHDSVSFEDEGLFMDMASDRLLSLDPLGLYEIDPADGNRITVGKINLGYGWVVLSVAPDWAGNRLFYVATWSHGVYEVSMDTFVTTEFSANGVGTGELFITPEHVALDLLRNRLLVHDSGSNELRTVNMMNGNRSDLVGPGHPSAFNRINGLQVDSTGNNVYVLDAAAGALELLNLDSLESIPVAGGGDLRFAYSKELVVDEDSRLAWTFIGNALVAIDMVGGDHVTISR